jgi:hypothetical protein
MRRTLAFVALLSMALAGCSDGSKAPPAADDRPQAYDEVVASETTGSIVGIVVNQAIVPLAGVAVKLTSSGAEATTDAEGAFLFNGLEPGDYFVTASKLGYSPVQQSATVVAGEGEPPLLRIQLVADPSRMAFATTEIWEGFVSCAATVGADGAGYAGGHVCDESMGSRFIHEFAFADGRFPSYVQDEMVWDNTQPLGDSLSPGYYRGGLTDWKTVTGPSPLLLSATADEVHAEEAAQGNNLTSLTVRVFPGHTNGPVVTSNQQFTIYHTTFYGFTPREGWLFTADGACDPAEKCAA